MSCLLRRSNGIYYHVASKHGKRVWTSLHTQELAKGREAYEVLEAQTAPYERSTIVTFRDSFLARAHLNFRPKTAYLYEHSLSNYVRLCGNKMLKRVTPLDVESFKEKRATEVSAVTVNIELKTLQAAFAEATRLGLIERNPFKGAKKLRVPDKEGEFLKASQFKRLMMVIDEPAIRNIVTFAVHTMLRRGEIVNLKWDQMDMNRRVIHVKSSTEFRVKGGRARWTPMSPWVYNFLKTSHVVGKYVFCRMDGRPYDAGWLSHRFKKYVRLAELSEGIHFHSLRHTGVSWLMNKGVPAAFVQKIAGHSSLAVTNVYTHVEDVNLSIAIKAFEEFSLN